MATRSSSIVGRVARGSAIAASGAALVAAVATTALAAYWVRRVEDRRIDDAAMTLATELDEGAVDVPTTEAIYHDESEEMRHTGLLFAVYDSRGVMVIGDPRVQLPPSDGCADMNGDALRVCRTNSRRDLVAVVGAAPAVLLPFLAGAAFLSAALAAGLAWLVCRPLSRHAIAPLTRLRKRIADLDVRSVADADLGSDEGVVEVDGLRRAISELIERVDSTLALANRFAANAAHELRTPLTSVRAELDLLWESVDDPGASASASRAQQKVAELSSLVERLLILSTPARSATDAHELVSLRDLLEDAVSELPPEHRDQVEVLADDAIVHGDAVLLATMVVNAIANGLKFGKRVIAYVKADERAALLHVDDDGPGIPVDERERVFEPFFRSAHALRSRAPGHGLGLALIRHVAQTHGGAARFVEPAGGGARLEIELPLAGAA